MYILFSKTHYTVGGGGERFYILRGIIFFLSLSLFFATRLRHGLHNGVRRCCGVFQRTYNIYAGTRAYTCH